MGSKKKKLKRRQINGKPATKMKAHRQDAKAVVGHVERLNLFTKRAVELVSMGWSYRSIAQQIAGEFKLESVPGISTIAGWLKKADEAFQADIKDLRMQQRIHKFNVLDKLLTKFSILANADSLKIARWKLKEGKLQPVLDENALCEQFKAAEICARS